RVPPGRYATRLGDAIEIIQWHHCYAVVAPSPHPEAGGVYRWYAPNNLPAPDQVPRPGELTGCRWNGYAGWPRARPRPTPPVGCAYGRITRTCRAAPTTGVPGASPTITMPASAEPAMMQWRAAGTRIIWTCGVARCTAAPAASPT